MRDKKAITAVIGTIMLILMAVAAVGIIWGVVMPLIRQGAQEASISCIGVDFNVVKTGGISCYNATGNLTKVVVSRGQKELNLKEVMIRLADASGNAYPVYVMDDSLGSLPGRGGQLSYTVYLNGSLAGVVPIKVAVAAELESDTGEVTKYCDVISEVSLEACA